MSNNKELSDALTQLNSRGTALVVAIKDDNNINHKVALVSDTFTEELGFTIEDIPDKEHWWNLAYPDESYRNVVERQWELLMELNGNTDANTIEMAVNLTAKNKQVFRYRIESEVSDNTIPGHYVATFTAITDANKP